MNWKIDWDKLEEHEAQKILELLASSFNIVVKSCQDGRWHDALHIKTAGPYDDNHHSSKLI